MLDLDYINDLIGEKKHVDVVDAGEERFIVENYIKRGQPVKIKNMADSWSTDLWTLEYFRDKKGHLRFLVKRRSTEMADVEEKKVTLAEFVEYMLNNEKAPESLPFYLDTNFGPTAEMLADYSVPKYFRCAFDNFRNMPNQEPFSRIYLAPQNSIKPLHVNVIHSSAWNLVISGKKFWVFFPEKQTRYLYAGQVNPFAPNFGKHFLYNKAAPIICVQEPGETVFAPSGWYHAVLNLEMGVSLTENFINAHNFNKVKAYHQATGISAADLSAQFEERTIEF